MIILSVSLVFAKIVDMFPNKTAKDLTHHQELMDEEDFIEINKDFKLLFPILVTRSC